MTLHVDHGTLECRTLTVNGKKFTPNAHGEGRRRTAPVKPVIVMVGGFLGAGKTTLILAAAQLLQRRGVRVGVVLNDQATTWWTRSSCNRRA